MSSLSEIAADLRRWVLERSRVDGNVSESNFPRWSEVAELWWQVLASGRMRAELDTGSDDVLFLVASDWKGRRLIGDLAVQDRDAFLKLAGAAVERPDHAVQLQVAWAISRSASDAELSTLLGQLVESGDGCVRLVTVDAMLRVGHPNVCDVARRLCGDEGVTAELHERCLEVASVMGCEVAVDMARVALLSEDRQVRCLAAQVLSAGVQRPLARVSCERPQERVKDDFVRAVADLRRWMKGNPAGDGEEGAESQYGGWPVVFSKWCDLIQHVAMARWGEGVLGEALYAIDCDHGDVGLVEVLGARGAAYVVALAEEAARVDLRNVDWQCAAALGETDWGSDVEEALRRFLRSSDPTVRRVALHGLLRNDGEGVDIVATEVWYAAEGDAIERRLLLELIHEYNPRVAQGLAREALQSGDDELASVVKHLFGDRGLEA